MMSRAELIRRRLQREYEEIREAVWPVVAATVGSQEMKPVPGTAPTVGIGRVDEDVAAVYYAHSIVVSPEALRLHPDERYELLAHEAVHEVLYRFGVDTDITHGRAFIRAMRALGLPARSGILVAELPPARRQRR